MSSTTIKEFLESAWVWGDREKASRLLERDPELASRDFLVACAAQVIDRAGKVLRRKGQQTSHGLDGGIVGAQGLGPVQPSVGFGRRTLGELDAREVHHRLDEVRLLLDRLLVQALRVVQLAPLLGGQGRGEIDLASADRFVADRTTELPGAR